MAIDVNKERPFPNTHAIYRYESRGLQYSNASSTTTKRRPNILMAVDVNKEKSMGLEKLIKAQNKQLSNAVFNY
jgi:hypothetical protein